MLGRDPMRMIAAVGAITLCWLLLMPPGAGPDEPGHLVRSGAVIRGDLTDDGDAVLPDRYQVAEPGCYAFQPTVPVTCSQVPQPTGASLELPTRAGEYPVWGHAWFGAFSVLPVLAPLWWARLGGALIATVLVALSLDRAVRVAPALTAGLLIGVTPMAWSTFGTVNPSSIAIAGAIALWTGLLSRTLGDRSSDRSAVSGEWLVAIGWVALVLPRRDGLVWACVTLVVALAATSSSVAAMWRTFTRSQQAAIAASTVVTLVWGAASSSRSTQLVVLAPMLIIAVEVWRWWWHRPAHTSASRRVSAVALALVALGATYVLIGTRRGGWDTDLAVAVVMQTDDNLVEAIGVLGWLDAAVPAGAVYLWLIAIGMLAAGALIGITDRRSALWAAALAVMVAVTSWILELVQGNTSGMYWQGRYSIPLLVGVPLLLTLTRDDRDEPGRTGVIGGTVAVIGLLIVNVAAWSAARRFGVGTSGSLLPWRWDTPIQPVAPILLLAAHAVATGWLAVLVMRPSAARVNEG